MFKMFKIYCVLCATLQMCGASVSINYDSTRSFMKSQFVTEQGFLFVAQGKQLLQIDKQNMKIIKKVIFPQNITSLTKSGRFVYALTVDAQLYKIDMSSLKYVTLNLPKPALKIKIDRHLVYVLSHDFDMYCVNMNKRFVVWQTAGIQRHRYISADIALSGKYILVSLRPDVLSILDKRTGNSVREIVLPYFGAYKFVPNYGGGILCITDRAGLQLTDDLDPVRTFHFKAMTGVITNKQDVMVFDGADIHEVRLSGELKEKIWSTNKELGCIQEAWSIGNKVFVSCKLHNVLLQKKAGSWQVYKKYDRHKRFFKKNLMVDGNQLSTYKAL